MLLEHYAMTTSDTFRRAAAFEPPAVAKKDAVPLRNRTLQPAQTKRMALNHALQTLVDSGFMQPDAVECIEVALRKMTPTGLEPVLPP